MSEEVENSISDHVTANEVSMQSHIHYWENVIDYTRSSNGSDYIVQRSVPTRDVTISRRDK